MQKICTQIVAALCLLSSLLMMPTQAQPLSDEGEFTINLRDVSVTALVEQVSEITGRTLVLDQSVSGSVTVVTAEPLTQKGVWSLFQSILRGRGFVAVRSGEIWQVVSQANAAARGTLERRLGDAGSQDVVTRILPLNRLPAEEAVRVLRPLVAADGYIEALGDPSAVIVTDTLANADRIAEILRRLDGPSRERTAALRLRQAEAGTVLDAIREVLGTGGTGARLSVEAASNSLLVRGSTSDIEQIRTLVEALDVPPHAKPTAELMTHVQELNHADAENIAELVNGTLQGDEALTNPVAQDIGAAEEQTTRSTPAVLVQAASDTNAIVIRGTRQQIESVLSIVRKLDRRRPQIMIEAAIVEVSGEVAERLGTQLGLGSDVPSGAFAASSFANGGTPLASILAAIGPAEGIVLSSGLTAGVGSGDFGLLLQALSQSTSANLLSTPSVTTMDNETATIIVGQNVPFRTGSFATDGNTATPFTTIERRDVGITMEVLPRVTADGIVRLNISQEVSSLVNSTVEGASDLVTNRRVINTTVQARDRGTVVLGGLITDDTQSAEGRVPLLGDLPLLGGLFRSRRSDQSQRTLFVFMRPTIIDDDIATRQSAERSFRKLRAAEAEEPSRTLGQSPRVEKLPLEIDGLY